MTEPIFRQQLLKSIHSIDLVHKKLSNALDKSWEKIRAWLFSQLHTGDQSLTGVSAFKEILIVTDLES